MGSGFSDNAWPARPATTAAYGNGFVLRHGNGIVSLGLVPVTMGIVIASGIVIARAADSGWRSAVLTLVAVATTLSTRLNPMWMILAGAALGSLGLL
jgi:chromate transporter